MTCDELRQAGQAAADLDRRCAADAGIHLVEDERRHRVDGGDHDLDREHDAAELAARRALGDRPRLRSRMRREKDRDIVASRGRLGARRDRHDDVRIGHRERVQLVGDGGAQASGGFGARGRERGGVGVEGGCRGIALSA